MFYNRKTATAARWGVQAAGLACLVTAFMHYPAQAQERNDRLFSCSSVDGQRTYCDADTSRGDIRMTKQMSEVRCVEGYTWGREDGRIWVDRGCRAEFRMPAEPRRPVERLTRIEAGTMLTIRTNETIDANRADGRIFTGSVDQDVVGSNGELAIPGGSSVELIVRVAQDQDLILDLESVIVNGQRFAIEASPERVESKDGVGANQRTGKYVGGGALLGAIIGSIAGGGKGAAIGAGVGAAGGAIGQTATRGHDVRVPSESLVTFRIEQALTMGIADGGTLDDGNHYHVGEGR